MKLSPQVMASLLARVDKPARYAGGELNAVVKDPASVRLRWAFAFPDVYDLAMSNLATQILYHVLNREEGVACERVFAPWVDMEKQLRAQGIPLFTLETHTPVRDADILAFTLPYEVILSNVLNMIDLSGLPLQASARGPAYPLVIGGGALTCNPEPLAAFFDAFVLGDGEEVALEISRAVLAWKEAGSQDKEALLRTLAQVEGVYIPSFFQPHYAEDGRLTAIEPLLPGYEKVRRRAVVDFDAAPFPTAPVVPNLRPVHDRLAIEIARGCTAGCRFCQAGMITRPTRERSLPTVLKLMEEGLEHTGYEDVSFNSLSSGDYACVNSLLAWTDARLTGRMISTSVPSLKVSTLTPELARAVLAVKKSNFTVAPEAGTQRLRDAINKQVTEADLVQTVQALFSNGGQSLKLYFMCGLPGETEEDLEGIVKLGALVWQTARGLTHRPTITLSVSTFVPKPFTPFQWASQAPRQVVRDKIHRLKQWLRPHRALELRWHDEHGTFLEGIFSRGDRRLGAVLEGAWRLGCRFDGWQEHVRGALWDQAFREAGIDASFYLRERDVDEVLPWDHLDAGVSKAFLKREWLKHQEACTADDCRWGSCAACGACRQDLKLTTYDGQDPLRPPGREPAEGPHYRHPQAPPPPPPTEEDRVTPPDSANTPFFRLRLQFEKRGPARYLGHLELTDIFTRAMRRAHLPMRHSQGFHPLPRMMFSNPTSIGVESLVELMEVEVLKEGPEVDVASLVQWLNAGKLPGGLKVVAEVPAELPVQAIVQVTYRLQLPEIQALEALPDRIAAMLSQAEVPVKKKKTEIDARPLILDLSSSGRWIQLTLATPNTGTVKPTELLAVLMPEVDLQDVRVIKVACGFEGGNRLEGAWDGEM